MPDVRYWSHALLSLLRNAPRPGFLRDVLSAGVAADAAPKALEVDFLTAYPDADGLRVDMGVVEYRRSNMDPLEQYILAALVALRKPRRILEIGTYDGATTLLLARAAPPGCEVFTLDLPPVASSSADVPEEASNAAAGGAGSKFHGQPESIRITQLFGDSLTFDFSSLVGTVDFVLVDAGHSYENAAADSATALRLMRAGGTVVWDDYVVGWPGVVRAVDELPITGLIRPAGTGLAIYDRVVEVGTR